MKMKRGIAVALSGLLSAGILTALPVSAATYTLGDVDMDGYLTGHDAAMVTHYLHIDGDLLTEEQLALADVNQDGVVDQADADWIHENEVYHLGDIDNHTVTFQNRDWETPHTVDFMAAYAAIVIYAESNVYPIEIIDPVDPPILDDNAYEVVRETHTVDRLTFHLLDADADGDVDLYDAITLLLVHAVDLVESTEGEYFVNGRYDFHEAVLRANLSYCQYD